MLTTRWARVGAWTTAAVLGAGLASGVTWAAAAGGSSAPSSQTAASHGHAAHPAAGRAGRRAGRLRRRLLRRIEHGSLTLRAKTATVTVDVQKGIVSDVSPTSVTVTSRDGFKKMYDVTSASKVRAKGEKSSIKSVKDGNGVLVIASSGDVRRLFDPRPGRSVKATGGTTG
jgi:hypothetical protein